jgi:hypothetical protein
MDEPIEQFTEEVDEFEFSDLLRNDGMPVTDPNDLLRIDVDSDETYRPVLDQLMNFAHLPPKSFSFRDWTRVSFPPRSASAR